MEITKTIATIALPCAAILVGLLSFRNQPEASAISPLRAAQDALISPAISRAPHPQYRFSVVPGGIHDAGELNEVRLTDRVVRQHYMDINISSVRFTRLTQDREGYVSYRVGDDIYWTRHPVHLPRGEEILSDGIHEARVRCGNRISDIPQEPVEMVSKKRELDLFDPVSIFNPVVVFPLPVPEIPPAYNPAPLLVELTRPTWPKHPYLSNPVAFSLPVEDTPEPATIWLSLSGLGLILVRSLITGRRRRKLPAGTAVAGERV